MNRFVKISLMAAVMAAPSMADEQFGGVGITIYQIPQGVHVVQVIPGTPAAETKLQAGDDIVAVDGVSLKGLNIDQSKGMLRGQVNKPVEITFVSSGDTLKTTLRRTQITVKDFESKQVESWYGDKKEFDVHELENYASANGGNKQLVAVLKHGSLVTDDQSVSATDVNGIYVDKVDEFAPKPGKKNVNKASSAKFKGLSRNAVSFSLTAAGKVVVTIMNTDGAVVATVVAENAQPGFNSVPWNGDNVPSGRYTVSVEHNGSVSGANTVLK
jgi:membrane-associated protease RseP (regulator of RpoE activity)